MTNLTKTVRQETATLYRGRPLIIELHPGYLTLREKGKRHAVTVEYRAALDLGYKILSRAEQAERKARRRAR